MANDGVRFLVDALAREGRPLNLKHDAPILSAIVRTVEGLPLALQSIGHLSRVFSLPEILERLKIQSEPHFMASGAVALSDFLPALTSSFEQSWRLMTLQEREAVARLAVFPSDFDATAACRVARVDALLLVRFVDYSILHADGKGRLSFQPAVRLGVMAENPLLSMAVAQGYLEYYVRELQSMRTPYGRELGNFPQCFIKAEFANLQYAWKLALQLQKYSTLQALAGLLRVFIGVTDDLRSWFETAALVLRNDASAPKDLQETLKI